ncbi:MAG: biotin/lipoyl-containing protein, partial [Thermaurantiacus tibetensis]
MPIDITMPALSPTMEAGTLARWLVKPGDRVRPGDVIAEIETDKATMEMEAVDEGEVLELLVPEGTEGVKVNAVIARLKGDGEPAERPAPVAPAAPTPAPPAAPQVTPPPPSPASVPAPGPAAGRVKASPLARRVAAKLG